VSPQGFTTPYFFYGTEGHWNVMVMPMLSRSLEDCVQICKGRLSVKSALMVSDQVVRRIEYLHSKGILHRDIKPENFMWGIKEKQHHCYLIDFGLSKRYHDGKNHIVFKQGRSLTGTARYASLNAHRGYEQGRRDDCEAIGHMIIYFLRGSLPWSGLEAKTKEEKYRKIHQKKESVPLEELCTGYPSCFEKYLRQTRDLGFKERPDYAGLRGMFLSEFESQGMTEDYVFDWFIGKKQADYKWEPIGTWTSPMQPDDTAETPPASNGEPAPPSKKSGGFMSFCPCGRASATKD
jgi:casein kinase 1